MCGLHLKIDRSIDNPSPAATGLVARGMRRTSPRFPFMFWLPLKKKASWFVFAWHLSPSIPSCFGHFSRSARLSKKNNFFYSKVVRCVRYLFFGFLFFFYTHRLRTFETKRIRPLWTGGGGVGGFHVLRGWAFVWRTLSLSLSLSLHLSPEKMKSLRQSQRRAGERRGFLETRSFARYFPFFLLFKQQTTDGGRIDRSEKKTAQPRFLATRSAVCSIPVENEKWHPIKEVELC